MDQSQVHSIHHQHLHDGPNSTPQDVLAEARKNLQVLIDSGLSKDLLHQWVDEGQSLQLSIPVQSPTNLTTPPTPPPTTITTTSTPSSVIQSPTQSPLAQSQPQFPPQPTCLPPPPPPQCPPPPPPHQMQQQQQHHHHHQSLLPSTPINNDMKPHGHIDHVAGMLRVPTSSFEGRGLADQSMDSSAAAFFMPPNPSFAHRPRISVSSTSSGSSGHASIWSNNSANSAMSWQSVGSNCPRMQAPLPLPPNMSSASSTSTLVPGGSVTSGSSTTSTASKHNIYWCTSCETSFKRKYDWKRHEDEFHERWRKYPCPEPGCNRSFWGSNSFNQHHKQCHGCKTCPHADKVVKFLRKRKYWACGFCSALHPARERHVEHVARHFESGLTKTAWMHSRVVYGLMHQPLIHEAWTALLSDKQTDHAGRRPRFSWHPSRTGRAQGFLEHENNGQLQDLLEFFSGNESEAQWIVNAAYDLADIVFDSDMPPFSDTGSTMSMPTFPPRDLGVSFNSAMSAHQSMMPTPDMSSQSQYNQSMRSSMLMPTQPFSPNDARLSPVSSSHSPINGSHSPVPSSASQMSNQVKQEFQPLPAIPIVSEAEPGMMEFEYSPAQVVFEDWESMHSGVLEEPIQHQSATQGQNGWGMMQYFGDPRVAS